MKTSTLKSILIWALFCSSWTPLSAHKEPTHQYIIREAYKLLKLQLGYEIPELEKHVMGVGITDVNGNGNEGEFATKDTRDAGTYVTVPGGAWSEDQIDLVEQKHTEGTDYLIKDTHGAYTSINHFWKPDNTSPGQNEAFTIEPEWNPWNEALNDCTSARNIAPDYTTHMMAYRKALVYNAERTADYRGKSDGTYRVWKENSLSPSNGWIPSPINTIYGSLIGVYRSSGNWLNTGLPPLTQEAKTEFVYNIIGRIAHLLGDMSVPAHVHLDEHGVWHDPYEDAMNYKEWGGNRYVCTHHDAPVPASTSRVEYWYAKKIFEEKGGIVNPYCYPEGKNPIWMLFYTTAQIADHFASNRFGGNDYYLHVGEIESIINSDYNSQHPGPTTATFVDGNPGASGYSQQDEDLNAIRDATFPYVIRATAGLLYYYALEFGLLTNGNSATTTCPQHVFLQNLEIKGNNYFFKAQEKVQAGYDVNPSVTTGNFVVNPIAKNVVFRAGNEVAFKNGFAAKSGSQVHAYIGGCDNCTTEELNPVITQRNTAAFMKKQDEMREYSKPLPTIIPLGTNLLHSFATSSTVHTSHSTCGGGCCGKSGISKLTFTNSLGHNLIEIIDNEGDLSEYEVEELSKKYPTGNYVFTVEHSNGLVERRNIYTIQQ